MASLHEALQQHPYDGHYDDTMKKLRTFRQHNRLERDNRPLNRVRPCSMPPSPLLGRPRLVKGDSNGTRIVVYC